MSWMLTEDLCVDSIQDRAHAADLLTRGAIVALPTEIVYGLGVRADIPEYVNGLYDLKRRPRDKPFTILVASPDALDVYAAPCMKGRRLAEHFWPGPLTLVVSNGDGGSVGVRCPDHAETRDVLRSAGVPAAAPSAIT